MNRQLRLLAVLFAVLGCGACAPPGPLAIERATAVLARETVPVGATPPAPSTEAPAAPTAIAASVPNGHFAIDRRATTDNGVLAKVALELRTAQVGDGILVLRVAFVNTSNQSFTLIGGAGGSAARLADATGKEYAPQSVDAQLNTLDPQGGFAPGTANVGDLAFPLPDGGAPYELRFPPYPPINFRLDAPAPQVQEPTLADGSVPINAAVRSQREALRPIELRLKALVVGGDTLSFTVGFLNVGRQGYNLVVGPSGGDARLIDGEGQRSAPRTVSDTLARSIAPQQGWQPGQEQTGTITFARPTAIGTLRFTFPEYDAISIQFDVRGNATASITSSSGGAPAPTTTPSAEEAATAGIEALLTAQADAVRRGDSAAFLATLAPQIQAEQQTLLQRVAALPIMSYTLQLAPDFQLNASATQTIPIVLNYTLRGIDPSNVFTHDLNYDIVRNETGWLVTRIASADNPSFWWTGDLVLRETDHFLLVARPDVQVQLALLAQEAEQAYRALQARSLPLEPRYVAYFTATPDDFSALTGRSVRYLGVALSRYVFQGNSVSTTSRAFYINGARFSGQEGQAALNERQTTITHELVHLALADQTRPFTPPWLAEGIAVYFSEDTGAATREQLRDGGWLAALSLAALTRAGSLGEHDATGERTGDEYAFSGETVAYLIETYGEPKLLAFYRSYADVPAAVIVEKLPRFGGSALTDAAFADLSASLTIKAVPQFFGISLEQLDSDVKAWIAKE